MNTRDLDFGANEIKYTMALEMMPGETPAKKKAMLAAAMQYLRRQDDPGLIKDPITPEKMKEIYKKFCDKYALITTPGGNPCGEVRLQEHWQQCNITVEYMEPFSREYLLTLGFTTQSGDENILELKYRNHILGVNFYYSQPLWYENNFIPVPTFLWPKTKGDVIDLCVKFIRYRG